MTNLIGFSLVVGFGIGLAGAAEAGKGWVKFPGGNGPGKGKHVVLLAGDEEYRSEEALPMLAKILSKHPRLRYHGAFFD